MLRILKEGIKVLKQKRISDFYDKHEKRIFILYMLRRVCRGSFCVSLLSVCKAGRAAAWTDVYVLTCVCSETNAIKLF